MTKTCVSTTATRPHLARLISAIALPLPQDNKEHKKGKLKEIVTTPTTFWNGFWDSGQLPNCKSTTNQLEPTTWGSG